MSRSYYRFVGVIVRDSEKLLEALAEDY